MGQANGRWEELQTDDGWLDKRTAQQLTTTNGSENETNQQEREQKQRERATEEKRKRKAGQVKAMPNSYLAMLSSERAFHQKPGRKRTRLRLPIPPPPPPSLPAALLLLLLLCFGHLPTSFRSHHSTQCANFAFATGKQTRQRGRGVGEGRVGVAGTGDAVCGRGSLVRVGIKLRQRRRRRRGRGALRVPRGNKNWFAHSFVSIGVVHTSHAHCPPAIPIVLVVAHLLFMPFLFEFPRKSIYNVFIRFVFSSCCAKQRDERIEGRTTVGTDRQTDRPVNSLAPFLGFGYYDNPTHTPPRHTRHTLLPPPLPRFWQFSNIFAHMHVLQVIYLTAPRVGEQESGKEGRGVAASNCQVACAFMFAQQHKQPRPNTRPVFLQQSHVCLTHK